MTPGADPDRHVNFPFFNTPSQFKTFIKGAIECFRQDAVNAILATQPYKGGKGHQLWVLNRLNNIDKHRLLLVAQSGWYDDINLAALLAQSNEGLTVPKGLEKKLYLRRPAPSICPLKAGDVLAIRPEHAAMDYELQLRFEVSLHEPHVVESKPILKTAQDFADLVRSTVAAFKPCLS